MQILKIVELYTKYYFKKSSMGKATLKMYDKTEESQDVFRQTDQTQSMAIGQPVGF